MGIASDPVNLLVIGAAALIVIALILDEIRPALQPLTKRWRSHLSVGPLRPVQLLPLVIAVVLAVLMRAWLISAYGIVVGLLITIYYIRRDQKAMRRLPARQIFQLILSFRSMYQLQPSVFSTLDLVKSKIDEPLRGLIGVVAQTYFLTSSPQRAFAELRRRSGDVYLNQLAYILEMSETARPGAVVEALDNLVERLRRHDQLRRETESNLATITGQTKFIQVIAVLVIAAVSLVPQLHEAYMSTSGQILFIAIVSVMLAASYYLQYVIDKLAERIS
jgi:Flp pilus assembly protein TadB